MPVTKSARKALRVSERRHQENLTQRYLYKKNLKAARKATESGAEELPNLISQAQSALDKAAKNHTIHPNKAARLKSRLSLKAAKAGQEAVVAVKKVKPATSAKKKTSAKKSSAKKTSSKK